ncbi:MAG: ribose transport system permease protein [Epulopiscium sp.]|nr:ribose transport system permease protein [Candidatus Epulonipiscium sp.]
MISIDGQIKKLVKNTRWISQENVLLYFTIALFILFSFIAKGFFNLTNFFIILRSMSIITVLGLGITFVITTGEIDLSIGTIPALCGAILAVLLQRGFSLTLTILVTFFIAILIGLINGLIIVNTNLPGIIVTLATSMIASGVAYILTKQAPVVVTNQIFMNIFGQDLLGFPVMVLWMLFLLVISYILLHKTKFGRNLGYIGENRLASYFAGVKIGSVFIVAFIISALYSCMAGLLGVAQSSNAAPWMLSGDMMTAIASTIIGGTSLAGGKGNILGTIIGAFFLTMLSNGFLIFGIEQWVLYLINGIIIISALSWRYLPRT